MLLPKLQYAMVTLTIRIIAALIMLIAPSGLAWAQEANEAFQRGLRQQMFIMDYMREYPPGDSIASRPLLDAHLKALEQAWETEAGSAGDEISPYLYYWELRKKHPELPQQATCHLFAEQMVPAFLTDVRRFESEPRPVHAYPIRSGFPFIVNTGIFRCLHWHGDWPQLREVLKQLPVLISTYLDSGRAEEPEKESLGDIQNELAMLTPLLEIRDELYKGNLDAAFAGLAGAFTQGYSAPFLISLGKAVWRRYVATGETDKALATLDLLTRSLTAGDLPRDSLQTWYKKVDPERGLERFSQMAGAWGLPVLVSSGEPVVLSGQYPNLTTGEPFDLSELKGKVVLFDFWATWCSPCIAEIPKLKELVAEYGSDFVLVSISSDALTGGADQAGVRDFMEEHGINYMVLYDGPESSLTEKFGVAGWPSKFLVSEKGEFMKHPTEESRSTVLLEEVEAYLASQR